MSEIKAGDLVMVVRGHGCYLGRVYTVAGTPHTSIHIKWTCWHCAKTEPLSLSAPIVPMQSRNMGNLPLAWLLKIDPPASELDTETEREFAA